MADVPTVIEVAETAEQKAILRVVMNATEIGKPLFTTPGVPADRLDALRRAFDQVVKDKEFIAEFEKARVELKPLTGEQLQKLVSEVSTVPPDIMEKVKANYGG